jgi:hypothetical protein
MKWLNDLHPSVNHMEWLEEECEKLKEIVGKYKNSEVDWQEVSKVHGVSYVHGQGLFSFCSEWTNTCGLR